LDTPQLTRLQQLLKDVADADNELRAAVHGSKVVNIRTLAPLRQRKRNLLRDLHYYKGQA